MPTPDANSITALQYFLAHFAVTVSAISGVLAGSGKRVDLFGVIVLGLVTALGGGTVRDVILQAPHVFWIDDSNFVINAVVIAAITFAIARYRVVPEKVLGIADAFGLALFAILGAAKGLKYDVGLTNAVVLGVITGVAGGILRDILVGEIPLVFRRNIYLYATAAVVGATVFVVMEKMHPGNPANRLVGIGIILALRIAAMQWKLSLPEFER
jgi:uncharacterized membrane protein YeiH